MITDILSFTLIVRDQQEALQYYTEKLGFEKRGDNPMWANAQWITVAAPGSQIELVLQPPDWFQGAEREEKIARIGQSPTIVFRVDDCKATYEVFRERGVEFTDPPTDTSYGIQAIFKDLYGNGFVLLERAF